MANKKQRPKQGKASFRDGFRIKGITAAALNRHITAVEAQHGHKASAKELLASAQPESSPIHHLFEWDDAKAAIENRLDKARYILRAVVVEYYIEATRKTVEVRAHVFSEKVEGYVSVKRALTDKEIRAEVVARALEELRAWQEKYRDLHELASIFRAIEKEKAKT